MAAREPAADAEAAPALDAAQADVDAVTKDDSGDTDPLVPVDPAGDDGKRIGDNNSGEVGETLRKFKSVALNFATTLCIVAANKLVFMSGLHVPSTTLTWLHYVSAILFSRIAVRCGVFERVDIPMKEVFKLYGVGSAAVLLMNATLELNSVELYQVMKALVLPWSAVLDFAVKGNKLGLKPALAVLVVTAGAVGVAVSDLSSLRATWTGLAVGLTMACIAPVATLWSGPFMKRFGCSALQAFYHGSVVGAVMLFPFVLWDVSTMDSFVEPGMDVSGGAMVFAVTTIVLSCCAAYFINLTAIAMARDFTGASYYVLNNSKSAMIVVLGVYGFGNGELGGNRGIGLVTMLFGLFAYPFAKRVAEGAGCCTW